MLYYLAKYLDNVYDFPGAGVFNYISFRSAMTFITSLVISLIFGKNIIKKLREKQIGETVRNLGLPGQKEKEGTPTMGGIIIILSIIVPTLLFADIANIYIIVLLITTMWLGTMGFLDDYIKVFKKNKNGLAGKFKIMGQIMLGIFVGVIMCCHPDVVIRERTSEHNSITIDSEINTANQAVTYYKYSYPEQSLKTTIPFLKHHQLDYSKIIPENMKNHRLWTCVIFIIIVTFIITAVSNCCNLTDGMDGLATGTSSSVGAVLAIFSWVSGNIIFADYLNIMMIPSVGELTVFIMAFVGACVGFMWYNTFPAQIFMGDTGSLTIGGIIAVYAIMIRKELLLPVLCGIFLVEGCSVIIQRVWFKITKKIYGEGRRVFLMAPLHHHYQILEGKKYPTEEGKKRSEAKIVTRFIIVSILLAFISIVTLKLR